MTDLLVAMPIMFIIVMFFCFYLGQCDGYKDGQIDYHNGKIKWKLEEQEDGSVIWVKDKDK